MGARFSAPVQTGPEAHPASCTMGTGSFPGVKSGRGVMLTPHLLLPPWSKKGRAIPLFPLWAVRPVQSLSACTRVRFTLPSVPVQGCTLPYPQCLYKDALYLTLFTCFQFACSLSYGRCLEKSLHGLWTTTCAKSDFRSYLTRNQCWPMCGPRGKYLRPLVT